MADFNANRLKGRIVVSTLVNNRWAITLNENQTIENVLDPTFLADASAVLMGHDPANPKGLMDIIEVRKPDTHDYWELMVDEIGKGFIKTHIIKLDLAPPVTLPESTPLAIKWNVGKQCHDVISKVDKQVMRSGFQTKQKAADWIAEHMRAMAA